MRFGLLLSRITTPIIMALVFFLVLTPMALFRRLLRKDALQRQFDDSDTYRVASKTPPEDHLDRPY